MRRIVGLSLAAAIALAACSPAPAPKQEAKRTEADSAAAEEAVNCMTWLSLQVTAIESGGGQGDIPSLNAAFDHWRGRAGGLLTATELTQYFASNMAVLGGMPPADIAARAETCRMSAPH